MSRDVWIKAVVLEALLPREAGARFFVQPFERGGSEYESATLEGAIGHACGMMMSARLPAIVNVLSSELVGCDLHDTPAASSCAACAASRQTVAVVRASDRPIEERGAPALAPLPRCAACVFGGAFCPEHRHLAPASGGLCPGCERPHAACLCRGASGG